MPEPGLEPVVAVAGTLTVTLSSTLQDGPVGTLCAPLSDWVVGWTGSKPEVVVAGCRKTSPVAAAVAVAGCLFPAGSVAGPVTKHLII